MSPTWLATGVVAAAAWLGGSDSAAVAKDYFLGIGGGYDASGNPASLERDVQFAAETIAANAAGQSGEAAPAMEIYFSDGDDPARDVQFASVEAAAACPATVRIMAELFGDPESVDASIGITSLPTSPARRTTSCWSGDFERWGASFPAATGC